MFSQAIYVSANEEPDILKVTFVDKYMFVGKNNIPIEFNQKQRRRLKST